MQTLSNVSQATHDVASAPHNKVRNRFINIHPCKLSKSRDISKHKVESIYSDLYILHCFMNYSIDDFSRVPLKEILGEEGSDYINASYIDVRYVHGAFCVVSHLIYKHSY